MNKVEAFRRIEEVANKAEDNFWETVAELYPEIKGGDFAPEVYYQMTDMMRAWIRHWIDLNHD